MEIKALLNKPYTENERLNFIIENNHEKGYEIRETEEALEAWGLTQEEIAIRNKSNKIAELDLKIKELNTLSIEDILYNNNANIKIYKDIIDGLKETKNRIIKEE